MKPPNTAAIYELAITKIPQLQLIDIHNLLPHFKSVQELFLLPFQDWPILDADNFVHPKESEKEIALLSAEAELKKASIQGWDLIHWSSTNYPSRLRHCPDAPLCLYASGPADLNPKRIISIVGTRISSKYGRDFCDSFIRQLKAYNCTVVSGLAKGIDAAAHQACLNYQVPTMAVLGNSIDKVYPAIHKGLSDKIEKAGRLISEFPYGTIPYPTHFPQRNRIVAGMCDATLVVEAGASGGALITASLANSYHREVFALPGKVNQESSIGCNRLIKNQQARLLEDVEDLAKELNWDLETTQAQQLQFLPSLEPVEASILQLIEKEGKIERDTLAIKLECSISKILAFTTSLELKGLIKTLPGNCYALN